MSLIDLRTSMIPDRLLCAYGLLIGSILTHQYSPANLQLLSSLAQGWWLRSR